MSFRQTVLPPSLAAQVAASRVIPFLGSGISRNAGLPDWPGLLRRLIDAAGEFGVAIAHPHLFHEAIDLGNFDVAAHALLAAFGDKLTEALRNILAPPGVCPTETHRLLATVVWRAVITTNFDKLAVQSFPGVPALTWRDQQSIGNVLKTGVPHLMLAHGSIDRPETIVLAPQDYRESLRNPALQQYMKTLLSQNSFLFLGFSLKDYDLKFFLEEVRFAFGPSDVPHFALLPDSHISELDIEHFRDNYGVELITYTPTNTHHPEVEHFVRSIVDHVPQAFIRDPLSRVDELSAIQGLRASMTGGEYLRQFTETCERVAKSGFLRTAWTALSSEIRNAGTSVSPSERVEAAITLAEMQIADDATDRAYQPLRDLRLTVQEADLDCELLLRFETVLFRVCLDGFFLQDARESLAKAENLASSDPAMENMKGELAVATFLYDGSIDLTIEAKTVFHLGARAEATAMAGSLEEALTILSTEADRLSKISSNRDAAWLYVKLAELAFMNNDYEGAWAALERIRVLESSLTDSIRVAYSRNRSRIGLWIGREEAIRDYYVAVDQEPTTKQNTLHLTSLIGAEQASREQKHYDSLPPLWRELRRSYKEGDWGARKRAHQRLADETLAVGWVRSSIYHSILGANESCGKQIVQALIAWEHPEATGTALTYILEQCFLTSHTQEAAQVLALMADIIPDERLGEVIGWLLRVASRPIHSIQSAQCVTEVWKATRIVAFRFSETQAAEVLEAARSHSFLQSPGFGREAVLKVIAGCLSRVGAIELDSLASLVLPMATTARSEIDYTTVLALLSEIASRAPELRASILDILCSPGQPQDLRVAALAAKLGRKIRTEDLSKKVTNIANQLPFQVWVGNGEPPEFKLSVFGTLQAVIEEKLVRVAILSGVELDFLLCYKDDIPETEWSTLLGAVLQMIEHPLNTRRNRILQIDFVTSMRDRLTPEQARTAIATIWKFADATAAPSPSDLPQPTTMDAFKFNTPTPGQLEGVAIGAVAKLSVRVSDDTGVERLLKPALLHVDPFVRALACMLLAESTMSTRETDALIVASAQDTDVNVASAALHSVRVLYERGDIADLTALLIALSQRCFRSKDPIIRRHSVRLSVALHTQVSYPDQKAAVSSILNSAEKDPHFSVRSAAKEIPIAAGGSNQNVVSR